MYASTISFAGITLLSLANAAPANLVKRASGKAGISWPIQELSAAPIEQFFGPGSAVKWWWDWNKNYGPGVFKGDSDKAPVKISAEFIPMEYTTDFLNNGDELQEGYTEIMGYNEPDLQSTTGVSTYVDPADAAADWKVLVKKLRASNPKVKLHSPAMATDINWLKKFADTICPSYPGSWKQCEYAWDITNVHHYTVDVEDFKNVVSEYHTTFGLPVVVSEFACSDFSSKNAPQLNQQQVNDFMSQTTQWLDNQKYVERYAWFGSVRSEALMNGVADVNRLMDTSGQLTALGKQYIAGGQK